MHDKNPQLDILIKALDDAKAIDVTIIHVSKQTTITDYMIICSGRSSRQVKGIAQQIIESMKTSGLPAINSNGMEGGEWALIDFGDFIVHVMQPESRSFYNLEGLWQDKTQ